MPDTQSTSSYLQYLPAIFQEDANQDNGVFVGRFLLAFEQFLSGLDEQTAAALPRSGDPSPKTDAKLNALLLTAGLEQILDRIHTYFDPGPNLPSGQNAPEEFLNWLAGWVALSVRDDWHQDEKRRFISRMATLYRIRGTKRSMVELLHINTGVEKVVITENQSNPHFFKVVLSFNDDESDSIRMTRLAKAIIDLEKPAFTYYFLEQR